MLSNKIRPTADFCYCSQPLIVSLTLNFIGGIIFYTLENEGVRSYLCIKTFHNLPF